MLGLNTQGLHFGPPFFRFITFTAVSVTVPLQVDCLTRDGMPVTMNVTFQYVPLSEYLEQIAKSYRDASKHQDIVSLAAASAVVDACSQYKIADYQTGRPLIQSRIDSSVKANLQPLWATSLGAQLVNVVTPDAWKRSTGEKQKAAQDIDFARNERAQKLAQASSNMQLAQLDARITNQTATRNITMTKFQAQMEAAAVFAEYESLGRVAKHMMEEYNLDFGGLMAFFENSLVRNSKYVDMVLPNAVPGDRGGVAASSGATGGDGLNPAP